jgi:hypothetical protein
MRIAMTRYGGFVEEGSQYPSTENETPIRLYVLGAPAALVAANCGSQPQPAHALAYRQKNTARCRAVHMLRR